MTKPVGINATYQLHLAITNLINTLHITLLEKKKWNIKEDKGSTMVLAMQLLQLAKRYISGQNYI